MRSLLRRTALALVGVVVAIGAFELAARALDPFGVSNKFSGEKYRTLLAIDLASPRLFRHLPSAVLDLRGWTVRTNSLGFRGPEIAVPKPPHERRLLFLGDSVVLGWGVDEEDTFVHRVGAELRARHGACWRTINSGHAMYDSTQEEATLREVGLSCEPEVVALVYVDNDQVETRSLLELQAGPVDESAFEEEARDFFRVVRALGRIRPVLPYTHALLEYLYVRSHAAGRTGAPEHALALGLDLDEGRRRSKEALRRIRDLCRESGVGFVVLDSAGLGELERFCESEEILYAGVAFTAEEARDVRNSVADPHANPRGHELYARRILDALESFGLVADCAAAAEGEEGRQE